MFLHSAWVADFLRVSSATESIHDASIGKSEVWHCVGGGGESRLMCMLVVQLNGGLLGGKRIDSTPSSYLPYSYRLLPYRYVDTLLSISLETRSRAKNTDQPTVRTAPRTTLHLHLSAYTPPDRSIAPPFIATRHLTLLILPLARPLGLLLSA